MKCVLFENLIRFAWHKSAQFDVLVAHSACSLEGMFGGVLYIWTIQHLSNKFNNISSLIWIYSKHETYFILYGYFALVRALWKYTWLEIDRFHRLGLVKSRSGYNWLDQPLFKSRLGFDWFNQLFSDINTLSLKNRYT